MTRPRARIEASLAERGRPAMWANEQEAAVLSGFPADGVKYRAALPGLEKAGFPPISEANGLRFIPAIVEFWRRQVDAAPVPVPESPPADETDLEDFTNGDGSQRKSA